MHNKSLIGWNITHLLPHQKVQLNPPSIPLNILNPFLKNIVKGEAFHFN